MYGTNPGTHGFTYHVPNGVDASLLAFRPCGSRTLIDNSWIVRRLEGRIEHYSHGTISGWTLFRLAIGFS